MHLGKRGNYIIHDKKFVFMMLKKCASVTMGRVILSSLGHRNLNGDNVNRVLPKYLASDRYEVASLEYTKLVWVRNPFNRLVSGWFDRIHLIRNEYTMAWYGVPNTISFPDFIYWICSIDDSQMNAHFRQQTSDITIDGELIPNVIIKLENLKEEWPKLQARYEWLADLRHANKSKKGDYKDYYTSDLIEKVRVRFKDDFRLLNYDEEI